MKMLLALFFLLATTDAYNYSYYVYFSEGTCQSSAVTVVGAVIGETVTVQGAQSTSASCAVGEYRYRAVSLLVMR